MQLSVFDLFKVGIGPSSSHTVGPMRAARSFALALESQGLLAQTASLRIELFGSLALTGRGHCTDKAVVLGLLGETPDGVDSDAVEGLVSGVRERKELNLLGKQRVRFDDAKDLLYTIRVLPRHSNALTFSAFDSSGATLLEKTYYSIGGGFVVTDDMGNAASAENVPPAKYEFTNAQELLAIGERENLRVDEIALANERRWRADAETSAGLDRIWGVMEGCIARGLRTEGVLPGGLNVKRRAAKFAKKLEQKDVSADPLMVMDWVNIYAMAVNEENAAGGRVVTAPTNGAAGIIPAVAKYYMRFVPSANDAGRHRYFLTAGVLGMLYKVNASISGAEVGCQGEVGVACSMAAGGLVSALNGSNAQIEQAAEIGMEHHLGMTCDPVGGLVQIPCIERNALGSVKAINAARLALSGDGQHRVSLDQVMRTMMQTGQDMQARYKETSQAGLAVNVVDC